MVNIISFADNYYRVPDIHGLEEIVRFPDSDIKRNGYAHSSVWVFDPAGHELFAKLMSDIGCGMAAFALGEVDAGEAADKIYNYISKNRILGNGNHFIDICSRLYSKEMDNSPENSYHKIMIVHTDGKANDKNLVPKSIEEAKAKQMRAEKFRENIGHDISLILGVEARMLGNWTHNSVEYDENTGMILYRKGAIKVAPGKLHILPAHIGANVLFYTVSSKQMPPHSSMPHGTGRSGPTNMKKVSQEDVVKFRQRVYIPAGISDASLRAEHPACYNNFDEFFKKLGNYVLTVGHCIIESYVGRV